MMCCGIMWCLVHERRAHVQRRSLRMIAENPYRLTSDDVIFTVWADRTGIAEADRAALHVRNAGEAVCIGPAPSSESYLRGDKIIEAALKTGATAIHPGYGFLSENAAFARSVVAAGLTWIGPPASAYASPMTMRRIMDLDTRKAVARRSSVSRTVS